MRTRHFNKGQAQGAQSGFTLIEILVTIAIAAILAGVAVPSLSTFLQNVRLNATSSSLMASLQQARSEAIKRNAGVLVCPSNTDKTACAQTSDWGVNGWLVCYDIDNNGVCDDTTAELPNPISIVDKVEPTFAKIDGPAAPIRFAPSGSQGATGAGTVALTIKGTWAGATALNVSVAGSGLIKGERASRSG